MKDINTQVTPLSGMALGTQLAALSDTVLFRASPLSACNDTGAELWRSDATQGITGRVADVNPGLANFERATAHQMALFR
jgi:ELWxxDGT repeat protein